MWSPPLTASTVSLVGSRFGLRAGERMAPRFGGENGRPASRPLELQCPLYPSLSFCQLRQGTLPSEWGLSTSLAYLAVNQNSISGTIPPSWGQLTGLQTLRLSQNSLSGEQRAARRDEGLRILLACKWTSSISLLPVCGPLREYTRWAEGT